jgi:hypothetical protein
MRKWWQRFRDQLDNLLETYGRIVLVIWFSIYGLTLLLIGALLSYGVPFQRLVDPLLWLGGGRLMAWLGFSVDTAAKAGLIPAVWALSRLTFPLRVVLTGAITPPIARRWLGGSKSPP